MSIAQKSTEYTIRPAPGGFRVLDKNQHSHGTYPTYAAAEIHVLELTATRRETHQAAKDLLTQATAALLLVLALLLPAPASAQTCTPNTVFYQGHCIRRPVPAPNHITCRKPSRPVLIAHTWVCRYP